MNHVIAIRVRASVHPSVMLSQVAVILRMCDARPRWIEILCGESEADPRLRLCLRSDAVSLAPLVELLRSLPECSEVLLEVPPSAPPAMHAAAPEPNLSPQI